MYFKSSPEDFYQISKHKVITKKLITIFSMAFLYGLTLFWLNDYKFL